MFSTPFVFLQINLDFPFCCANTLDVGDVLYESKQLGPLGRQILLNEHPFKGAFISNQGLFLCKQESIF